jgi:hypothetical protein
MKSRWSLLKAFLAALKRTLISRQMHRMEFIQTVRELVVTLRDLHRRCFYLSNLNFMFGNDKTFSNGPFSKSKGWNWTYFLSKACAFGQTSCPNNILENGLDELDFPRSRPVYVHFQIELIVGRLPARLCRLPLVPRPLGPPARRTLRTATRTPYLAHRLPRSIAGKTVRGVRHDRRADYQGYSRHVSQAFDIVILDECRDFF